MSRSLLLKEPLPAIIIKTIANTAAANKNNREEIRFYKVRITITKYLDSVCLLIAAAGKLQWAEKTEKEGNAS